LANTFSLHQWRRNSYRLYHRQPSFIQGPKCNCKRNPLLDELGHHISTACGQGGYQIMTHDSVKLCIKDLLWYQKQSRSSRMFQSGRPIQQPVPRYNALQYFRFQQEPFVADVCITCPIPVAAATPLPLTNARKPWTRSRSSQKGERNQIQGHL
jgi:hypothetical protein